MPAILIMILSAIVSSLIARMIFGAGLAILTFNWINNLVDQAVQQMQGFMYNLPADIFGAISILMIPQALSVVMSAIGLVTFIKSAKVVLGKSN
ncbi:hypothetical protein AVENLUH5627_02109 [Acinetobacter venetianus]|uniref:DUF2523 domain-containing protein n=1 Tax=Acinetobacter venetianus TaxID=52133 RepID=A0A150HMX1_9GAMM|nr:DUF2523 family protein [Acinetobacter venetianus]KXZ67580.1 hypothetical protein AVENLUH5627_02109 [Acinetobacter venetianus]